MLEIHHRALLREPGDRLRHIDPLTWNGFCRGTVPLTTQHGVTPVSAHQPGSPYGAEGQRLIDILLLTLRQDEFSLQQYVDLFEPFRLSIDEHGFLQRLHVSMDPLTDPEIIDLRPRLVGRYLRRVYHWRPSVALIAAAMAMCGLPSTQDVRQHTPR
jgi:hypothetical protein